LTVETEVGPEGVGTGAKVGQSVSVPGRGGGIKTHAVVLNQKGEAVAVFMKADGYA
jgi:hypothetical protein